MTGPGDRPLDGARRTIRIGISGPIGCGKSTVADWLGEAPGVVVIDADDLAREVLAVGTPELAAVLARFGAGLGRPDGSLDRAALGRRVFGDPAALRDLEAIVHPAVRRGMLDRLSAAETAGAEAVVIEAIKLVEGGLGDLCDEIWLVTCDPSVQLEWVLARGSDVADARARIAAQGDIDGRLRLRATRVIDTSAEPAATRGLVEAAFDAARNEGSPGPSR
jgi:dephospho-CoA kinase